MKKKLFSAVVLPFVAFVVVFMGSGVAQAAPFERGAFYGYFYGNYERPGQDVFQGGIDVSEINGFVKFYRDRLYSDDPRMAHPAAFTVLTMLGYRDGSTISGVATARSEFVKWEGTVRWYDAQGRIGWNQDHKYFFNTLYQVANRDVAWYDDDDTRLSIVFYNPDNVTSYAIKKDCANPVGNMSGLEVPPPPPPPTVVTCGTLVPIASGEVNKPVSLKGRVTWSGPPPPGTTANASMSVTNTQTGAVQNIAVNASPSGATNTVTVSGTYTPTSPGRFTVTWTVTVNGVAPSPNPICGGSNTANDSFWATSHPYIDVQGGDVAAGASFATTDGTPKLCGAAAHNTRAGVVGWNNGSPNYAGAGGQYGTLAMNYIQSFITNRGNVGTGDKLAFANQSPSSGTYGGQFGDAPCVDYWNPKPALNALPQVTSDSINLPNGMNGKWARVGGNLTIGNSIIPDGTRLTLYVDGDVNITGPIMYQNNGAGWTNLSQIPSFRLIVHGRIFINAGVNQLDGTYVAVPDSSYTGPTATPNTYTDPQRGTISTCSTGFASYTPAMIAANNAPCNSALTVYGSLVANQIFFLRVSGSVTAGSPSEIISYGPETWLAPSGDVILDSFYQSITGLPPVL